MTSIRFPVFAWRGSRRSIHLAGSTLLLVLCALALSACGKTETHPLKGVVVEIYESPPALLIDHDAIPGFMDAMTMRFEVEAPTLTTVKKGDRITGRLRFRGSKWRLEDIHVEKPS